MKKKKKLGSSGGSILFSQAFLSPGKAHLEEKFSRENIFVNRARLCNLSSLGLLHFREEIKSAKQLVRGISTSRMKVRYFCFCFTDDIFRLGHGKQGKADCSSLKFAVTL